MITFFEIVLRLYYAQFSSTGLWMHAPIPESPNAVTPVAYHMAVLDISLLVLRIFKYECIDLYL